jgi:alpha-methylacyl-CoA racemase
MTLWSDEQELPMQHLRILDLSVMLPGPYVTRMLAQYGADVIKVENMPDGDPVRSLRNSACFELMNQGKRSVGVNLKTDLGTALVRRMAGEADVFVENMREGVMDRLGLGYADLSEENPDLLYLSLRGLSGKNAVHAAHDLNFIAASGVGEWFLESGTPNYSTHFGDIVGGAMVPTIKLMFHLANPARRGMHLVSYIDEAIRGLYLPRAYDIFKSEALPEAERAEFGTQKSLDGTYPHSRYYKCRDGQWVALNAIQEKHWETFCDVVDRAAWKPRMWDKTLVAEMDEFFQDAPSTYWEALSNSREICMFRVIPWSEHVSFSQARPQLGVDPLTWAGFAPNAALKAAPALGQDTYALMHSMGVSNKEFGELMQKGIIYQPEKK